MQTGSDRLFSEVRREFMDKQQGKDLPFFLRQGLTYTRLASGELFQDPLAWSPEYQEYRFATLCRFIYC